MKTRQVLGVVMGAALLSGTALAQANGPQDRGPRGDGPGMRPPCEGQEGAGMRRGGPGQEGAPGMMRGRRPDGMGNPGMQRGGSGFEGGARGLPDPQRLKEAGATDQQLEALKKHDDEVQLKRIDLKSAVEKAELTFGQLMRSENVEEKAALKAADALSQARADMFKAEISAKLKEREILGADVLKKLHDQKPPEGMGRQGRGQRPEGQGQPRRDAPPPAGDRPQPPPEQK